MDGALALAVTAGGLVMLYGHGRLVAHWLLPDTRLEAGAVAALGLTALALPGGLLNLLGLSGPYSLWLLAATGLLAVLRWPPARGDLDLGTLAAISPVLLWVLVLASTAQPAVLLNFSDDFSNYLVRPLRLLQTGSVAGNPFSGLGMDSLGALSFLQAFVLSVLPVGFITVVDTLLGLLLAALLVDALGRRAGVSVAVRSGAVLALLLVNPQIINASAVYLGAVALLAATAAAAALLETGETSRRQLAGRVLAVALPLALLPALKLSWVLVAMLFMVGLPVLGLGLRRSGALVVATVLALSPWLGVALLDHGAQLLAGVGSGDAAGWRPADVDVLALLHDSRLFWGGGMRDYWWLAALLAVLAAFNLTLRATPQRAGALPRVTALMSLAVVVSIPLCSLAVDHQDALRYQAGLLAAATAASLVAVAGVCLPVSAAPGAWTRRAGALLLAVAFAVLPWRFGAPLGVRLKTLVEQGHVYAFRVDDRHLAINATALSAPVRDALRELQGAVPTGRPLLAWAGMPFHLDFDRNPVFTLHDTALLAPWLGFPTAGDAGTLVRLLRAEGVEYVMWQQHGIGAKYDPLYDAMQDLGQGALQRIVSVARWMLAAMPQLVACGRLLRTDGQVVVFELPAADAPCVTAPAVPPVS